MSIWELLFIILGSIIVLYIIIPSFLFVCAKDFVRGLLRGYHEHKNDGGLHGKKEKQK